MICSQVHKTEGSGATDGMSLSSLRQPLGWRKYFVIPLYMQHICSQHMQPVTMSKWHNKGSGEVCDSIFIWIAITKVGKWNMYLKIYVIRKWHAQDTGEGRWRKSLQKLEGNHSCQKQINICENVVLCIYAGINSNTATWLSELGCFDACFLRTTTCTPPSSCNVNESFFRAALCLAKIEVLLPVQQQYLSFYAAATDRTHIKKHGHSNNVYQEKK